MHIMVLANPGIKEEFITKTRGADVNITFTDNLTPPLNFSADAFFLLTDEVNIQDPDAFSTKPVFINAVTNTLKEMALPGNFCRINAWPGFLNRELWEVASHEEQPLDIIEKLEWKYIRVADEPGLVTARIISMIINEAYFALGEAVSSKKEIDLAMKLGTNYPYGPFEWSEIIGLRKIYSLLEKLNLMGPPYNIAPAMKSELLIKS